MTDETMNKPEQLPNIVLIITDQQRQVRHWPPGLMEQLMPTMRDLQDSGVSFTNCYTAATMCSPSRASFLTGVYPTVNDVTSTPPIPPLNTRIMNLLKLAKIRRYDVAYKGKMHLFTPTCTPIENQTIFTTKDIEHAKDKYGFDQWNPPDDCLTTGGDPFIGGGRPNNDERFVKGIPPVEPSCMTPGVGNNRSIMDFLDNRKSDKPFFLVCSFGNPHDISVWPDQDEWGYRGWKENFEKNVDRETREMFSKIDLPDNYNDALQEKPTAQSEFVKLTDKTDPCYSPEKRIEYCQFYAYLHWVVDKQIQQVLDKLKEKNLMENTAIFRFADHGEMAQSHGMIQKGCNSYQETINVPLIVSYPKKFPRGETTDSFASLIDIVPTIAELMNIDPNNPKELYKPYAPSIPHNPSEDKYKIKGISLKDILMDPKNVKESKNKRVRDNIMFFTEDLAYFFHSILGIEDVADKIPVYIRSIRTKDDDGDWMYAVYFTKECKITEYEMYNLSDDRRQMMNLAWYQNRDETVLKKMTHLHKKLTEELDYYHAKPKGWPPKPELKIKRGE